MYNRCVKFGRKISTIWENTRKPQGGYFYLTHPVHHSWHRMAFYVLVCQ